MKAVAILALASLSSLTLAAEATASDPQQDSAVVPYTYGMKLDIAHVVSTTDISKDCGVVPARMTYDDSQGQRHTIQYRVWGNGCHEG
ncbi:DUF2790 domain-containing protein [Pseudomonas cavernae]|uniref:DUF2790 domain-containing protein n=1 Tax=Pseudomonas cavernae TaxID=2320867 RepID=A0A385Z172_9PSED|nr:DUF2790 domain-containing protein [Pseudomonas cavernae]AYC32280.1 DUF2790 domain-containing protein [Pseudomonas cavernae]